MLYYRDESQVLIGINEREVKRSVCIMKCSVWREVKCVSVSNAMTIWRNASNPPEPVVNSLLIHSRYNDYSLHIQLRSPFGNEYFSLSRNYLNRP